MDIIKQLKNIRYNSIIINNNLEIIENMRKYLSYVQHCSESSTTLEKVVLLESVLYRNIDELSEKNSFLISLIESLPDREKTLLTEKYINCKSWDEISECMFISRRTAYRIHSSAIDMLNDIIS